MPEIRLSNDQKQQVVSEIQRYFERELGEEIGQFDAEFLLDFFSEKIGPLYYNQALQDAGAVLQSRFDDMVDALVDIEKTDPLS